jgi:tetratricopeptide (TPR) repeat protein
MMEPPKAAAPGGVADAKLAAIQKEYDVAKAAYDKDAKKKDAYVKATVKIGTATMLADSLEARVKYRAALKYYREALKLDPANKEALNNKKMIEDIYTQMGRPIPE